MKLWHTLGCITLSMALSACAERGDYGISPQTGAPVTSASSQYPAISMPAVSGTVNIRQRIALPPNAVLTVTVSDASLADAPSKVIAQHVMRTGGKQAPFQFSLPYQPADIQPNARILLSAAVAIDNRIVMMTENVLPVISNGVSNADLILVPVASVPLPTKHSESTPAPTQQSQPSVGLQPSVTTSPEMSAPSSVQTNW
ncbi:YbaY family lipoprotein [Brenneria izbisi]|uniref:YbaY family lipoprotein n=1 Tax=Brenneria izbisi TaxID=2939450 RepID=A0AA41XVJ0_9GAMM|nr:YbaY family lipoprotein [Brenneria izbisi]MCV9877798.1 YbaY family lipoprotein [Brenneria izbisi]MCV9881638.1 YbaY family lipoprotein [Brenneria izbisi]